MGLGEYRMSCVSGSRRRLRLQPVRAAKVPQGDVSGLGFRV